MFVRLVIECVTGVNEWIHCCNPTEERRRVHSIHLRNGLLL